MADDAARLAAREERNVKQNLRTARQKQQSIFKMNLGNLAVVEPGVKLCGYRLESYISRQDSVLNEGGSIPVGENGPVPGGEVPLGEQGGRVLAGEIGHVPGEVPIGEQAAVPGNLAPNNLADVRMMNVE